MDCKLDCKSLFEAEGGGKGAKCSRRRSPGSQAKFADFQPKLTLFRPATPGPKMARPPRLERGTLCLEGRFHAIFTSEYAGFQAFASITVCIGIRRR